jgi:hypothetical protein
MHVPLESFFKHVNFFNAGDLHLGKLLEEGWLRDKFLFELSEAV